MQTNPFLLTLQEHTWAVERCHLPSQWCVWLPEAEPEAYVAETAVPNVRVQGGSVRYEDQMVDLNLYLSEPGGKRKKKQTGVPPATYQLSGQGSKCSNLEITTGPFASIRNWTTAKNKYGPLLIIKTHSETVWGSTIITRTWTKPKCCQCLNVHV